MLKELGTMSGSFYYPNQLLSVGVDISVFGFDKYREMMVRVLGGKRLEILVLRIFASPAAMGVRAWSSL